MKQLKLRAVTPIWAHRIDVERRGDYLLITGGGHFSSPIGSHQISPEQQSRLDILQQLRRFALRRLAQTEAKGGNYQFADANDDEKLISFCKVFGPVWGKVQSETFEESTGTWTVKVAQNMRQLRTEQRKFLAAVELCAELNKNSRADRVVLMEKMAQLGIDRENLSVVQWNIQLAHIPREIDIYLDLAHFVFCAVMNEHQLKLASINGEAIELPEVSAQGIREALYFQLRLDYLAQRTIGTCLNCGTHYSVFKRGSRACGEVCRRALRNRKYWSKKKRAINRKRRALRRIEE